MEFEALIAKNAAKLLEFLTQRIHYCGWLHDV